MKTVQLILGALLGMMLLCGAALAQERYLVVDANADIAVIENPVDRQLRLGEKFYILRRTGLREVAIAIAQVDRFKGKYCRVRIVKKIINTPPRSGDYLVDYDQNRQAPRPPLEDLFRDDPTPQPKPQTQQSRPVFATGSRMVPRFGVAVFTGLGLSNFSGEELYGAGVSLTQSGYLPLGAQLLLALNVVQFGAEFNYALSPFTFKTESADNQTLWEDKLDQMLIGALVRVHFLRGPTAPYVRGGAGVYIGDYKREFSQAYKDQILEQTGQTVQDMTVDLNSSFGFNLGAGVRVLNGFFEFIYHFVQRSTDVETLDSTGNIVTERIEVKGDNWAFQAGVQVTF